MDETMADTEGSGASRDGVESRKRAREPEPAAVETSETNGAANGTDSRKRARESELGSTSEETPAEEPVLTGEESAIYDRQIRVWGVEAQRRLSKARVLVVGMSGVIAETCKNIVLAGIASLTLVDDRPVTAEGASTNFLIYPEDVGREKSTLASVCAASLKDYNPMVKVGVQKGNVDDKPAEFYDDFDVVVLDKASLNLKKHVNSLCRSRPQKVAFYAIDCRYSCGSFFVDLQTITFTSKKKPGADPTQETKVYPSFEEALSVKLGSLPKKTSTVLVATRIVDEFELRENRQPGQLTAEDSPLLLEFAREYLRSQGTSSLSTPVEKLLLGIAEAGSSELPPVSAIMGGFLGQEIIKGASCKGEPLRNYFFFNTTDGKGIIEDISPIEAAPALKEIKDAVLIQQPVDLD